MKSSKNGTFSIFFSLCFSGADDATFLTHFHFVSSLGNYGKFQQTKKKTHTPFLAKQITAEKKEYLFLFLLHIGYLNGESNELTCICFIFFFVRLFFSSLFEIVKMTHGDKCTDKSNEHFYSKHCYFNQMVITM